MLRGSEQRYRNLATTRVTFKYLRRSNRATAVAPPLDHSGNVVGVNAVKTAEIIGDLPFAIKSQMATSFLDSKGVSHSTGSRGDQ
jgi:hypothetical protein